jgi:hypothetical protein
MDKQKSRHTQNQERPMDKQLIKEILQITAPHLTPDNVRQSPLKCNFIHQDQLWVIQIMATACNRHLSAKSVWLVQSHEYPPVLP